MPATPLTNEADAAAGMNRTAVSPSARPAAVTTLAQSSLSLSSQPTKPTSTKRQRRAAKNEKHAWPQHPKIQSAEQREKAYIRVAGLNEAAVNAPAPPTPLSLSLDTDTSGTNNDENRRQTLFARQLGSADARTRHQTVLQLKQYLQTRCGGGGDSNSETLEAAGVSELDLLKLWKCLWYTLYMADRVPVQAELSKHIASLIWSLQGTEEEDEYAAMTYLQMKDEDEQDEGQDDDLEDDDEEEDDYGDKEDDDSVVMEEIENTLEEEDSDEISVDSGEIDFEKKQASLLLEDEDEENEEEEEQDIEDLDCEEEGEDEEESSQRIDELGHCRGAHLAALFVRTFFRTVVREWGKMDKYRIDKFYTLIREMVHVIFAYMAKRHWSIGLVRLFNDAIYDECLSQTPNGVRYHVVDVCLDELVKVAGTAGLALTEGSLVDVLEPYFAMAQTGCGGDDTIHYRVVEQILEKFLTQCSVYSETWVKRRPETRAEAALPEGILDQVHVGTISQFIFDVAADEAVLKDEYRKNLYAVHKKYVRRINEVGENRDVKLDLEEDNLCNIGCCSSADVSQIEDIENDKEMTGAFPCPKMKENNESKGANIEAQNKDVNVTKPKRKRQSNLKEQNNETKCEDRDIKVNLEGDNSCKVGCGSSADVGQNDDIKTDDDATDRLKNTKKKLNNESKGSNAEAQNDNVKSTKPKRKRKPKQNKSTEPSVPPKEEEITITIDEQRQARKRKQQQENVSDAVGKKLSTTPKSTAAQKAEETEQERKRVKFGEMNNARSWKASMQGLRTATSISIASPERGILLNKGAKIAVQTERQQHPTRQDKQQQHPARGNKRNRGKAKR